MEENLYKDRFRIQDRLTWGRSSVGRAPALQAGGQEFESPRLHHFLLIVGLIFLIKSMNNKENEWGEVEA